MKFTLKNIELNNPKYCEDCPLLKYDSYNDLSSCIITNKALQEEPIKLTEYRNYYYSLRPSDCPLEEQE